MSRTCPACNHPMHCAEDRRGRHVTYTCKTPQCRLGWRPRREIAPAASVVAVMRAAAEGDVWQPLTIHAQQAPGVARTYNARPVPPVDAQAEPVEPTRREVRFGDMLLDKHGRRMTVVTECNGGFRVERPNNGGKWVMTVARDIARGQGWTFADTGERV